MNNPNRGNNVTALSKIDAAYKDYDGYISGKLSEIAEGKNGVLVVETPPEYSESGVVIGFYVGTQRAAFIDLDYVDNLCDVYISLDMSLVNNERLELDAAEQLILDYFGTQA